MPVPPLPRSSALLPGVAWSKLGRNISIELALDPARRALAQDFLAASRAEYDRLTEQSPAIDDAVIDLFRSRFKEYDVAKPAIAAAVTQIAARHRGNTTRARLAEERVNVAEAAAATTLQSVACARYDARAYAAAREAKRRQAELDYVARAVQRPIPTIAPGLPRKRRTKEEQEIDKMERDKKRAQTISWLESRKKQNTPGFTKA
eukprot:COSAG02_NODE_4758_length_5020_cov_2.428165_2_plen_205_part_00